MTPDDRTAAEQAFHDEQAADRAVTFRDPARLRFTDDEYLDHETWVRPAFAKLGDLRGKRALDFGCGHGMAAVVMARRGADVSAFDLSPGYVREAQQRAASNGVEVKCFVADGEKLPFSDGSFDAVWGNAVLHHLRMDAAGVELRRVLAPGGMAVFCEPWGGNPVLEFARRRLPYPGKHRTRDERPMMPADVAVLRDHFPNLTVEHYQLFGMVRRLRPRGRLPVLLDELDRRLFRAAPGVRKWSRYVVLTLPRD